MPRRIEEDRVVRVRPTTGQEALRLCVDDASQMLRLARQERRLNYTQLSRLCEGYSVAANTIKNYEDVVGSRANVSLMNLRAIALALQYDPAALMALPPYDAMDPIAALRAAELTPVTAGPYRPTGGEWDEWAGAFARWEVFQQTRGLSMLVLKPEGERAVDPRDTRLFVRGTAYDAWNLLVDRLRDEAGAAEPIMPRTDEGSVDFASIFPASHAE